MLAQSINQSIKMTCNVNFAYLYFTAVSSGKLTVACRTIILGLQRAIHMNVMYLNGSDGSIQVWLVCKLKTCCAAFRTRVRSSFVSGLTTTIPKTSHFLPYHSGLNCEYWYEFLSYDRAVSALICRLSQGLYKHSNGPDITGVHDDGLIKFMQNM